ncbi:hypothetical protein JOC58_003057 [Paenibacillus hunanensis]|uniref:Uncharacterized protein n=1 Tax=Paenibacillus hunanensis TaxID=539262 RepID=A0ABU1J114_9BACL|nr:hypothetical protein [Paenibacillus hunanensis]
MGDGALFVLGQTSLSVRNKGTSFGGAEESTGLRVKVDSSALKK